MGALTFKIIIKIIIANYVVSMQFARHLAMCLFLLTHFFSGSSVIIMEDTTRASILQIRKVR